VLAESSVELEALSSSFLSILKDMAELVAELATSSHEAHEP
jgi:hypothetical protein